MKGRKKIPQAKKKVATAFALEEKYKKKIKRMAKEQKTTVSQVIRAIVIEKLGE